MPDRALTKERGPAASRQHRDRRLGGGSGDDGKASWKVRPAFGEGGLHGRQNVQHRLLARLRLAAGFDRFDGVAEGRWQIRAVRGDLLAQRKEKSAVKRSGGA